MNDHISSMLEKLNYTSFKTNGKDGKITDLSSKQIEIIQNEVLIITSEHPYYEDNFERKFQAKLSPSNQFSEQPAEELIEFKGKQHMEPNKFSSEQIKHDFFTLTSEDSLETKIQAKFNKSDQIFEQPEEELMAVIEQQNQE